MSTSPHPSQSAETRDQLGSARVLARLLDDIVTIPGTRIGLGLDSLVGLVPGIGDGAGVMLSGAVLITAVRQGVPLAVLGRMVLNLGIDAVLGLVPVLGDAADVAHRANRKNVRLLEQVVAEPGRTKRTSTAYLLAAGTIVGATVLALAALAVATIVVLWRLLTAPL